MYRRWGKRLFDLVLIIPALIVLGPILAALTLLVWIKLGHPVLFCQQRPGLHGKPFMLYKFRSMSNERDASGKLLSDKERLSPFGRFLRNSSLDELPQLWNVLRGDLSVVGPRPLLMNYLERYTPEQARRNEVRPGITGWAQIHGRNATSWEERFTQDLWYVEYYSFWIDCRIILRTLQTLIHNEGIEDAWGLGEYMGPHSPLNKTGVISDDERR